MIRINLKERVRLVAPYALANFGHFVLKNHDLVRLRLLAVSFSAVISYLNRANPGIFKDEEFCQIFRPFLNEGGMGRFARAEEIRSEDLNPHMLRRTEEWDGVVSLLKYLNTFFMKRQVQGKYLEFEFADLPDFPRSFVKMRAVTTPVSEKVNRAMLHAVLDGRRMSGKLRSDRLYGREELYQIFTAAIGRMARSMFDDLMNYHSDFLCPAMRPYPLEVESPLYALKSGRSKMKDAVRAHATKGQSFPVLEAELAEIVAEGRLVPVFRARNKPEYFTLAALEEEKREGKVVEIREGDGVLYVYAKAVPAFLEGKRKIITLTPSAAQVFLDFLRTKTMTIEKKRTHPLLTVAIEALSASPRGADPYFEAASIAATRGASEEGLAALLLLKETESGVWFLSDRYVFTFHDHLYTFSRGLGLALQDWDESSYLRLYKKINALHLALSTKLSTFPVETLKDIKDFLCLFLVRLRAGVEDEGERVTLEYFSHVLGQLKYRSPGGIDAGYEQHLRVVVAPLAERCGFKDLADMIRDQIFRLTRNRLYLRIKEKIEKTVGLSYSEMELHLQQMAELVRTVLTVVNIPPSDYRIDFRVKLPYSLWEKMESSRIRKPGHIYDLFGINVAAKDDWLAYRIVDLLLQVFPEISGENFEDKHGLVAFMKRRSFPHYKDEIIKPKESGFSAVTVRRLSLLKLPLEIQVTSSARDKVNREEAAAHWKHKIAREINHFYHLGIDRFEFPEDHWDGFDLQAVLAKIPPEL